VIGSFLSFGSPYLLLFLLLVPLAIWGYRWLDRRRAKRAAAWASPALLPNMLKADPGKRRYLPLALFLLGITLLLVGFARPQARLSEPREDATVVLALDVSGSMAATDVHPTRLLAADASIETFLKNLPSKYRAALVTFGDDTAVPVPPTVDRDQLIAALPRTAKPVGTAMGDGIAAATLVATRAIGKPKKGVERPPATILLLSDGTQNAGHLPYQTAAKQAAKAGIPISTVLVGTPKGMVCQKLGQGACQQKQVPVTPVALTAIAKATGGDFYQAASADQLNNVYKQLGSRLAHEKKTREVTEFAVGGALLLILAGAVVSGLWFRRLV
jgi:Ca-activated chloride channel homolog